ncbi:hypothetical protein PNEG_00876 [Pneumocystis murina B123]|uniref:FRG1-like family protein n=1 Tax=Pneumocystis murina (strain B123) TaxID=1069680 RepID=M7NUE4_PNEMU|nr:hypothetical protein PNEG_00876 [Pneumocystis murina B123]EMR10726.1 hypothetical protein PNEG_00876 [Pneumocystis murina B123]
MSSYPTKSSKLSFKGEKKKRKKRPLTSESVTEINTDKIDTDDTEENGWIRLTSLDDINGPIFLVFLSSTPIALSCDASGKVFGMPINSCDDLNLIEPDDVRQVWVSTALSDTGKYSFKSSTGKYLSCDKYGFLSAKHDAVGYSEQFECFLRENGLAIQSVYEKFISVHELDSGIEIRGDAETIGFCESFRAKIQGCYKKRKIVTKETTVNKIRSKELESMTGRKLSKEEIIQLKTAFKEGTLNEALLDIRVKHGRDKFAFY